MGSRWIRWLSAQSDHIGYLRTDCRPAAVADRDRNAATPGPLSTQPGRVLLAGPPDPPSDRRERSYPAAVTTQTAIAIRQAQQTDPPLWGARVRQRFQPPPRSGMQTLAAWIGFDHAHPRTTMPLQACRTSFTQISEIYMIRWRARVYQQFDFALLVTYRAKPGNSGTRPSPDPPARVITNRRVNRTGVRNVELSVTNPGWRSFAVIRT